MMEVFSSNAHSGDAYKSNEEWFHTGHCGHVIGDNEYTKLDDILQLGKVFN